MIRLSNIRTVVCEYRAILIPVWLTVTLLTGAWVNSSLTDVGEKSTSLSVSDVLALEIAWTEQRAKKLVSDWDEDEKSALKKSIYRDYWFIPAYCILLVLLLAVKNKVVIRLRWNKVRMEWPVRRLLVALVILAALLDIIENIFMTRYLDSEVVSAITFSLPATIKFCILILTTLVLLSPLIQKLFLLGEVIQVFKTYFIGIASVAIIYFILIKLTPGQDVVIQVGEFDGPFYATILCLTFWAGVMWYSSRLVGYVKVESIKHRTWLWRHENVPRIIAFNAFVSVQASILALPTVLKLDQSQLLAFVLIQNMLYFIWTSLVSAWRDNKKTVASQKVTKWSYWGIFILFSTVYVVGLLLFVSGKDLYAIRLSFLALGLYVLQFLGIFLQIERRRRISKNITQPRGTWAYLTLLGIKLLKVPADVQASEKTSFQVFHVFVLGGIFVYAFGFNTTLVDRMGSLAVTLISFAMLVGVANILTVTSIANKINLFFYLFVWALLLGSANEPYAVRITETKKPGFYEQRPSVDGYFKNWIKYPGRRAAIEEYLKDSCKFPVYLVIADGGASRSGYWVSSVLSALEDGSQRDDKFSNHLFCLAGASGGSVGNATFYSMLAMHRQDSFLIQSKALLGQDFLSPVIFRWLGSDVIKHLFPWAPFDDRAAALERAMENFEREKLHSSQFSKLYSEVVDTTGKLPLLFINVTQVQQGQPSVISPVRLEGFSERLDVLDRVRRQHQDTTRGDLNFSTAVVMGARFPYVSPGGGIGNEFFADGGYFDNTGAGIVHEMMQHLRMTTYEDSLVRKLISNLDFRLIYLSNAARSTEEAPLSRLTNDLATPLLTVLGTYGSQTVISNQRLVNFINNPDSTKFTEFNLFLDTDTLDYPMNWVISDFNLRRMDVRLDSLKKDPKFINVLRFR
ncbi:MAG TPA: hypothetical protein VF141_02525 [Chryseolinea sp.]